jgi:hypothetical protein
MARLYFVCTLVQVDEAMDVVPLQSLNEKAGKMDEVTFVNDFHLQMVSNAIGISARRQLLDIHNDNQISGINRGTLVQNTLAKCEKTVFSFQIEHLIGNIVIEYKSLNLTCKQTRNIDGLKWQITATYNEVLLECSTVLRKTKDVQFFTNKHLTVQKISSISDLHTLLMLAFQAYIMDILFVEACCVFSPSQVARLPNGSLQLISSNDIEESLMILM